MIDSIVTLFTITNSTFFLGAYHFHPTSQFPTIANLRQNSNAIFKQIELSGLFGHHSVFILSSSTLVLLSLSISFPNTLFSPKSLVHTLEDHSSLCVSDTHFSNFQVSGEEPLLASSSTSFVQTSRSSNANISLQIPTDQLLHPPRSFGEWKLDGCDITNTCGAISGLVFCDTNWASSFICSNSSFIDSPSILTTPNPNSNATLHFEGTKWIVKKKGNQESCLTIAGPGLTVSKCTFAQQQNSLFTKELARGILFQSPHNDITLSTVAFSLFHNSEGPGILILGADRITLSNRTVFNSNSLRDGGIGGTLAIVGPVSEISLHSSYLDANQAKKASSGCAPGMLVRPSHTCTVRIFNSTFLDHRSNGSFGGLVFADVKPETAIHLGFSWFLNNQFGSIVFLELANPSQVKVTFETCRFKPHSKSERGGDVMCRAGWDTIITPSSFLCCVTAKTGNHIFVEGGIGDKDDYQMPPDSQAGCEMIRKRPKYFSDNQSTALYSSLLGVLLALPLLIATIVAIIKCFIEEGCQENCADCWKVIGIGVCFGPYLCRRHHRRREEMKQRNRYVGRRMNTKKKVVDTAFRTVEFRRFDVAGFLEKEQKRAREEMENGRHQLRGSTARQREEEMEPRVVADERQADAVTEQAGHTHKHEYGKNEVCAEAQEECGRIELYDGEKLDLKTTFNTHKHQAICGDIRPDGKMVACGTDKGSIFLYNTHNGKQLRKLHAHKGSVKGVSFSHDNKSLFTTGDDNTFRMFDIATSEELVRYGSHSGYVQTVVQSPVSQDILATSHSDHSVCLWNIPSLIQYTRIKTVLEERSTLTPEEKQAFPIDVTEKDIPEPLLKQIELPDLIESLIFLPGGSLIAAASGPLIHLIDIMSPQTKPIHSFSSHTKAVTALAILHRPNHQRLLTASLDGTVKIHELENYSVVHGLRYGHPIFSLAVNYSSLSASIAVGMTNGTISIKQKVQKEESLAELGIEKQKRDRPAPKMTVSGSGSEQTPDSLSSLLQTISGKTIKKKDKSSSLQQTVDIIKEPLRKRTSTKQLAPYDRHLRRFEYKKALDAALSNRDPNITVAVLAELSRRRAIEISIQGRDADGLRPLLTFLINNITKIEFYASETDVDFSQIVIPSAIPVALIPTFLLNTTQVALKECEKLVGLDLDLDYLIFRLKSLVDDELAIQAEFMQLQGVIDILFGEGI
ncbi:putative U3 small nucleolar RNA-associated protein 15 like protein [Blattamonas nauphoetae]|uniref:U3 small nucleolar RNA-associated protein 15 like protein n=1 Tax=Blattamonas nauphoetae TaxID=2049346 RepID=A0ABQ9XL47_9EUKA|nr:putative U3 small nucleolar RNA-associated protein 15 like protein [Blattamonas nauphoetae]